MYLYGSPGSNSDRKTFTTSSAFQANVTFLRCGLLVDFL